MQLDRKTINRVLDLDDRQLRRLIEHLATEAGVDASALGVNTTDLTALRRALGQAGDAELEAMSRSLEEVRRRSKGGDGRG